MSKENNNNKNVDSSIEEDEFKCDIRANESEENGASTGEIGSNNNDGATEQTRREENLFSLKHFLKQDTNSEPHNQMSGVRPKIPSHSSASEKIRIKRSPRFSSFDSQASLVSSLPQSSDVTNIGSHAFQPNRTFSNFNSDVENSTQKNTPIQRSCSAYDQRPLSFLDTDKNTDMLSDAFRDLYPNLMKTINPDNPSVLPDFVQDHLLMEKFYYKDNDRSPIVSPLSSSYSHQYDHQLPDFTLNENDCGRNYSNNGDMPFDLMCNSNESNRSSSGRNALILPLDLPIDLPTNSGQNRSQMSNQMHNNYQLDLTARTDGYSPVVDHSSSRNSHHLPGGGHSAGESFQTLPDFLSDGHIHSTGRQSDLQELQETSPESNFDFMIRGRSDMRSENSRLRLEICSRQQTIEEQARRIAELESTLASVRHNENSTANLEDVARNIYRNDERLIAAQSAAEEYKKQVLHLTAQVEELRQENEILKEEGAVGGASSSIYHTRLTIPQSQQFAKELMIAASTAETNLRKLLNGVENLRLMARKMDALDDSMPRNDYSDCDDDDFVGPNL
ncbi:hypothetical protein Bhyg_04849 [Pseudolycoriella hygida]|uniref:Endosome-associated-trafficking regulator 1 n=1 Tax=Pseudolycoriella hygida TaxID=35572 RepID=A0A9Q0NHB7_9DIPT|nr:hypothetical protein Bhyg_04849 [Pseudolycoriella hygida]